MKIVNGKYYFGFFDGTPYGHPTDKYEDFVIIKNSIDKEKVIDRIENSEDVDFAISSTQSTDMFTGEKFNAAIYSDGDFNFTIDFLRYYKSHDIGIPYEYEEYLKTIL